MRAALDQPARAQQASGVAIMLGLGLAALGGPMVPIELVRHGGGLLDLGPQLGVLAGYPAGLFAAGGRLFHRAHTR